MAESFSRRYVRHFTTLTEQDQQRLHSSKICQLGLGGLGGTLLEMLARMGFGRRGEGWIRTADGDVFEDSNLNRQLFCLESNIGRPKAEGAMTRIEAVNSDIDLTARQTVVMPDEMPGFIQGADIVLDALGDLPSKLALRRAAAAAGLPVVSAGVAGWTGFITTHLPNDMYSDIFQGVLAQGEGAEVSLGTLAPCVWLIAALQCREAVALACGHPPLFHGSLHIVDLTDAGWERIMLMPESAE
ncbi:Molybdopterin or thiamine biosynthesis adenylyltransferase [Desulfonatronum thiosulfatophilum]|uniref:Molybdopterin or thiamine biosynthesis adenylyltransferase n=1 Tax=Desulfonatronum thiosulfatophilum TaxID=617002 RepID=A0A1G6AHG3_9BACT|nr:ThiF family adenylyltransferase [Desulfonatronum thiosulfatophilum]SDB07835.1 Molybdopterin or thiamine biosynthesis adenylyltransferase [Desulfonatronum thiosulfatophilum]